VDSNKKLDAKEVKSRILETIKMLEEWKQHRKNQND
jgi:hypothetical protein